MKKKNKLDQGEKMHQVYYLLKSVSEDLDVAKNKIIERCLEDRYPLETESLERILKKICHLQNFVIHERNSLIKKSE